MESANASTPHAGCTLRYCAPELLREQAKGLKRKPTSKSDIYSLSMVIVEVYTLCGNMVYPGSDNSSPSL